MKDTLVIDVLTPEQLRIKPIYIKFKWIEGIFIVTFEGNLE